MRLIGVRFMVVCALVVMVAACGGGGGGGGTIPTSDGTQTGVRAPLPTLTQDIVPSGIRLDLRDRYYFPLNAGDTWTFDKTSNGVVTVGSVTRSVESVTEENIVLVETIDGARDPSNYRKTTSGVEYIDPFGSSAPLAARNQLKTLLEYPEPFYAVGEVRSTIRQGDWGADFDGDGIHDSFRIEVSQVLVGFESMNLPLGSADTAHFRTTITFTSWYSLLKAIPDVSVATDDSWFAPGIGLVRSERTAVGGDNSVRVPRYAIQISGGTVAGEKLFVTKPDGTIVKVAVDHNALVFDASRNRYYATIPGSSVGHGNTIASIDALTGAVTYSSAIGSEPSAMALSNDGGVLYVGLNGSGEVIKLSLPNMRELSRTRLPSPSFYGQLLAENIAISPVDSDVVTVSTYARGISPRHQGVALIRAGVLQSRMTQSHTGSNLIVFDANGQFVYGYNNETTEFGLRRLQILTDGVTELSGVVSTNGNFGYQSLDFSPSGLLLGNELYRPSDLALLGRMSGSATGCRSSVATNRLICLGDTNSSLSPARLAVVDPTTFVTMSSPAFKGAGDAYANPPSQIVVGPAGQVALRFGQSYFSTPASELWIFTSPALF